MKFNIDNYKGKYVMHCKTVEEANDFCKFLDSIGRCWQSGKRYIVATYYDNNKAKTCYNFNDGVYRDMPFYVENNYTILEWSDFMNKEFTKSDLKSGDVVKRRNGAVEIVCLETGTLISPNGCCKLLKDVREDLTDIKYGASFDIIAVRRPTAPLHCRFDAFYYRLGESVYERPEEMTLEEICKALGREIKIVKEK